MNETKTNIYVLIPAYNEEKAIGKVIAALPKTLLREVVVVNNASTDHTAQVAAQAGATVLLENEKGYGAACLRGLAYLAEKKPPLAPDIVVFIDGDYSDYPEELPLLVAPIVQNTHDLVIGSRNLGTSEKGALTPQQLFGNWLATRLLRLLYKVQFTDLGPFRAIAYDKLRALHMQDRNYGWTVEMQAKAAQKGLRCTEIAVRYRPRIGTSKISGTLKGTILAGYKILWTIFKYA
ncbi:MAG: glycosyltransferase family 2 protein [Chitinophagales bacterium]|nr:glycosyltransferase family 2 protein [Bacteroidota bacterium]MCB9043456.1 glycosyltransferase family 2 protein [Chitinophagales bacterium]